MTPDPRFTRRAFSLVLASALVPGSAQWLAGSRPLGALAMKVWLGLVALVVIIGLSGWLAPGRTLSALLALAVPLKALAWLLLVAWVALLVDAWRLAYPPDLPRRARLGLTGLMAILVAVAVAVTAFANNAFGAAHSVAAIFNGGGEVDAKDGRFNVLLLGVDAAASREGLRPDSITVASIDKETGATVLFGLPRNLQGAPFPESSPLRELYPDGHDCAESACLLNGVYLLGQEHADLYPGVADPGLEATEEVVEETLGLDLNYYAMIDMAGFESLIDAMGGVTVDIAKPIPIGGGSTPIHGYIVPGDEVHLDGYHALWFARSRAESSDYERMVRQKCVIAAMTQQLDPTAVAAHFEDLAAAGKDILRTDVPPSQIPELVGLALKAKNQTMRTVNFTPPLITTADPELDLIRTTVTETLNGSDASATSPAPAASTPAPASSPRATPSVTASASATRSSAPADAWICRVD